MMRRPGVVVALAFALGSLLGLSASSTFLSIEESNIRSAVEARSSSQTGPFAAMMIEMLDERDIFGPVANEVRADQRRNLLVAAAVAAVVSVGLGAAFSRIGRPGRRDQAATSSPSPR